MKTYNIDSQQFNGGQEFREHKKLLDLWASVGTLGLYDARKAIRANGSCWWLDCDNTHPGSFLWVMELFDLNPEQVRRKTYEKAGVPQQKKWSEEEDETLARLTEAAFGSGIAESPSGLTG